MNDVIKRGNIIKMGLILMMKPIMLLIGKK